MNLNSLKTSWNHFKFINGMNEDIDEQEILAIIEGDSKGSFNFLSSRIAQNIFAYSILILALNGGCSI